MGPVVSYAETLNVQRTNVLVVRSLKVKTSQMGVKSTITDAGATFYSHLLHGLNGLMHQWQRTHMSQRGAYSIERLQAFEDYCERRRPVYCLFA